MFLVDPRVTPSDSMIKWRDIVIRDSFSEAVAALPPDLPLSKNKAHSGSFT